MQRGKLHSIRARVVGTSGISRYELVVEDILVRSRMMNERVDCKLNEHTKRLKHCLVVCRVSENVGSTFAQFG